MKDQEILDRFDEMWNFYRDNKPPYRNQFFVFFLSEIKRAVKEREDEIVKAIKEELETQVIGRPDFMKGYDKALEYIITLIEDKK